MKRTSVLMLLGGALVTASLVTSAVGCSDDDDKNTATTKTDSGTDASEAGGGDTTGTISGKAIYTGTARGDLSVAVFTSFPPAGPPSGVTNVASPSTYPASFEIKDLDPGHYFLNAFIVTGAPHMNPTEFDPVGGPVEVDVVAGKAATADITLSDPAPTDAGTDAPADAPADG